ncbi:lipopolysaccharide biosynthesis protein [Streptomyces sp. NPDC023998]|uniref:lipopolysaccharide biosynthesis protein n=1 Tax=Streptomyces sp. NPDC023998 TaxID=3154597 RepID=UPI0033D76BB7
MNESQRQVSGAPSPPANQPTSPRDFTKRDRCTPDGKRRPWQRHLRTFGSLTAAGQVEAALSFATTAALVRLVGVTDAGQVFFVQSVAAVWFLLWDPRFEEAQQRFVPAERLRGPGRATRLYHRLLRLDIAVGLLATFVGVVVAVVAAVIGWIPTELLTLLVPAVLGAGVATPSGSASAGFALADELSRLGAFRVVLAVFGCLVTLTALLTAGPVGYLAATVVTGLVSTVVLTAGACRWLRAAYGPPVADPMATPPGLVPFLVKTSVTGSVSVGSESGVSLLAGLLGGPALVTYLKVATSMARFFVSFVSPVAAQLYPRLAHAGAHGRRTAVMSDALRSSALTGAIGALAVVVAAPLTGLLLGLVYGAEYMLLSTAAVVFLAGAALRGTVIWGKVLPTALGFPGVRLAFVAAEGVCQVGMIVTVTQLWAGPARMTLAFAWGSLCLLALSTACWFLVLRVLVATMPRVSVPTAQVHKPIG